MGMFDYVIFEMKCPECGRELNSFQTKSSICIMATLNFWEVDHFYDYCECGTSVKFTLKEIARKKIPLSDYEMTVNDEKREIPKELL